MGALHPQQLEPALLERIAAGLQRHREAEAVLGPVARQAALPAVLRKALEPELQEVLAAVEPAVAVRRSP